MSILESLEISNFHRKSEKFELSNYHRTEVLIMRILGGLISDSNKKSKKEGYISD